jgi:predicted phage tail protein
MKRLLVALVIALSLLGSSAYAAVFLVCNPYPSDVTVTKFEVEMDGVAEAGGLEVMSTGETRLKHDITNIPKGKHVVRVRAANTWDNQDNWSDWSTPFLFSNEAPSVPSGLSLSE